MWTSLKGTPTLIGLVATIVTFTIQAETKISARWTVLGLLLEFALILALLELAWRAFLDRRQGLPRVIQSRKPAVGSDPAILLLEPSELYSFGDLVTFYYVGEDQFEELIGIGAVVNIQQDGKIQALLQTPVSEQGALIERLASNEAALKRLIRVKPNVQRAHTVRTSETPSEEAEHE